MDKHLIEFIDKAGSKIIIRSVELSDGPNLIEYMGKTAEETRFLQGCNRDGVPRKGDSGCRPY